MTGRPDAVCMDMATCFSRDLMHYGWVTPQEGDRILDTVPAGNHGNHLQLNQNHWPDLNSIHRPPQSQKSWEGDPRKAISNTHWLGRVSSHLSALHVVVLPVDKISWRMGGSDICNASTALAWIQLCNAKNEKASCLTHVNSYYARHAIVWSPLAGTGFIYWCLQPSIASGNGLSPEELNRD